MLPDRKEAIILQEDIKSAFIKVGIGAEKKSKVISDKEKKITAYHEAGHAILFHVLPDMDPVYTISIIPTGMGAAGYTMPLPENDEMFNTKGTDAAGYHGCVWEVVWQKRLFLVMLPQARPMISSRLHATARTYGDEIWYV